MTKVAFVGKGGSGKTTLAALFGRFLGVQHDAVLAIDADINQHLGEALGLTAQEAAEIPPLGLEIERIKHYLRGTNERIASDESMIKTTPPGRGSRLVRVKESNPLYDYFSRSIDGVKLLVTGPFGEEDWTTFYRQAVEFHRKNALAWANAQMGEDLTLQIDPEFRLEAFQAPFLESIF